jgi:hypothetical protein
MVPEQQPSEMTYETVDHLSRDSQRSDDSFSAYIEHPIRQSTPPRSRDLNSVARHYEARRKSDDMQDVSRRNQMQAMLDNHEHSGGDDSDGEEEDSSWPTIIDHDAEEEEDEEEGERYSQRSIVIPDMPDQDPDQDDEDGDADTSGEKKRRRRTNKAEAGVLASV